MGYRSVCCVLLLALALASCDRQAMIQKFTTPRDEQAARTYLEDVRTGNFAPVQAAIDPTFSQSMTQAVYTAMRGTFGPKPVKSVTLMNASFLKLAATQGSGPTIRTVLFEYDMGDHFVVANVSVEDLGKRTQIEGIHVQSMTSSVEQANAFSFSGKNFLFYVFFALVLLIPIFTIATEIICWRTPIPRHKWLWRIFVLLGIVGLNLNWTTGDIHLLLLRIDLLGASYSQQPYGPLIVEFSLPIGAILFWIRRRKWLDQAEESTRHFS